MEKMTQRGGTPPCCVEKQIKNTTRRWVPPRCVEKKTCGRTFCTHPDISPGIETDPNKGLKEGIPSAGLETGMNRAVAVEKRREGLHPPCAVAVEERRVVVGNKAPPPRVRMREGWR
jgi:hypothetical protein